MTSLPATRLPGPPRSEPPNDRDAALPPTLRQLVVRWLRNALVMGLLISITVHIAGALISRYVTVGGGRGGGGAGGEAASAPVEMAIMTEAELSAVETPAVSLETPAVPDTIPQVAPEIASLMDSGPGDDAAGGGADLGDVGPLAGGGDISGDGGIGMGGAGGGGSSFFGVEAQGNRFAFIVDVSGSMAGPKLDLLKRELIRSIDGLLETSEFVIIQFADSNDARIVGPTKGWVQASPAMKRSMRAEIELLEPLGNTFPLDAFRLLAATRPRPDAVYFLTDGDFNVMTDGGVTRDADKIADEIIRTVAPWRAPVHTLCLDTDGSEARMKRIAKQTRGTYTFVRGPR